MKLLCIGCDEPMRFESVDGPEQGSVSIAFGCSSCGHRVALLTNPTETQLVRSLGVKFGGRALPREPLEVLSATLGPQREGVVEAAEEEGPPWAEAAETRLGRLPPMARPMARLALSRYARERGATVVTPELMDEYRARVGF